MEVSRRGGAPEGGRRLIRGSGLLRLEVRAAEASRTSEGASATRPELELRRLRMAGGVSGAFGVNDEEASACGFEGAHAGLRRWRLQLVAPGDLAFS